MSRPKGWVAWTEFEMEVICLESRPSDDELADMLGRSKSSIQMKRFALRNEGWDIPASASQKRPAVERVA